MGEARTTRADLEEVLRLAWPLILSNSFWTLQIMVDRLILSRSGGEAVGAGMMSALVFWSPLNLAVYTVAYVSTFVAQYVGAGRVERVGPAVWQALYCGTVVGLCFMPFALAAHAIFAWTGHTPALQELEAVYFRYLCFSALPTLWSQAACGFFTGRGDSRTVLLINGAGLIANVVLCVGLVQGRWGLPALGIAGAGLATVVGSSISAFLSLGLFLRPRYREFGVWSGWRLDRELLRRLLRFGLPNGVLVGLDTASFALFIALIGRLGEVQLAATSIAFTLNLLVFLPTLGVGQAVSVLVGQRLGEDRPDLAARSCRAGLVVALALTAAVGAIYLFAPHALAEMFRSERDVNQWHAVAAWVPTLLRFVVVYCLFDAVNLVFSNALRGAGDTRFVTVVTIGLSWGVMLAPTWVAWSLGWGLYAAWTFASVYLVLLSAVCGWRYRQGHWRAMRVIEPAV